AGAALSEEARARMDEAQVSLPALEGRLREAGLALSAQRADVARLEQALALSAQAQRDADRQLQQLSVRRERLQAQAQSLQRPDSNRLAQLAGDLAAATDQLEQAEAELLALEERLPRVDAERRDAQQAAQREAAGAGTIEARLAALTRLQQDVQQQGAL